MKMNKKFVSLLIVIDLIWSVSAVVNDWEKIVAIPFWFWPFILICSVYPLLLAWHWSLSLANRRSDWLSVFAVLPAVIYFVAALIYYPVWMILNGFDILAFGQIFWVAVYGVQAIYLMLSTKLTPLPAAAASSFIALSFIIQLKTNSFGFFDTTNFSKLIIYSEYLVLTIIVLLVFVYSFIRSKASNVRASF